MAKQVIASKGTPKARRSDKEEIITTGKGTSTQATTLQPTARKNFVVALGRLVSLDATTIPNAKLAMRAVNKKHLESLLKAKDEKKIPPIKVQNSNYGFIIIDGYHRYMRKVSLARVEYAIQKGIVKPTEDMDVVDILSKLGPVGDEEKKFIDAQKMAVEALDLKTDFQVLSAAMSANLDHGLPATGEARCRYAFFLIEEAAREGKKLSLRQAGDMVGVSHVALQHFRDAPKRITEGVAEITPEIEERVRLDKEDRAGTTLAKALRTSYTICADKTSVDAASYLYSFFKVTDLDMLQDMLSILNEVTSSLQTEVSQAEEEEEEEEEEEYDDDYEDEEEEE